MDMGKYANKLSLYVTVRAHCNPLDICKIWIWLRSLLCSVGVNYYAELYGEVQYV